MKTSRFSLTLFPLLAAAAFAQASATIGATSQLFAEPAATVSATATPEHPESSALTLFANTIGETSVTLDVSFGVRAVPPSRVTVPVGERLRITAPRLSDGINYIWTKNGRAIVGAPSSNVLEIESVSSGDTGTYACFFSSPTSTSTLAQSSQQLILGVGPTDRLLNLSTRAVVTPGPDGLVSGFVVGASSEKKLILRAIGPSLAQFGVSNPLRKPVLKIFDSAGKPYENGYAYPAVVGGPTYETDLAESLARTGAFPVAANNGDAILMMPFKSGTYTAQITSGDGTNGTVLLEIYEVP